MATGSVPITQGVGTPIRIVTNPAVDAGADQQIMTLADSAGNIIGEGGSPLVVREPKDTNRTSFFYSAAGITSVTTEALMTVGRWGNATLNSSTQFAVTAGKTLRIQTIKFSARFTTMSATVTFANARFNFRSLATGTLATTTGFVFGRYIACASNLPSSDVDIDLGDGFDLPGGYQYGFSHISSAATLSLDLFMSGYEY